MYPKFIRRWFRLGPCGHRIKYYDARHFYYGTIWTCLKCGYSETH